MSYVTSDIVALEEAQHDRQALEKDLESITNSPEEIAYVRWCAEHLKTACENLRTAIQHRTVETGETRVARDELIGALDHAVKMYTGLRQECQGFVSELQRMTLDRTTFAKRTELFQRTFPVAASDLQRRGRGFQVEHLRLTADSLKSTDALVVELAAGKPTDKFIEVVDQLNDKNQKFDAEQDEDRQATEAANQARAELENQRKFYNRAVENLCERHGVSKRLPQYLSSYGPRRGAVSSENPASEDGLADSGAGSDLPSTQGADA